LYIKTELSFAIHYKNNFTKHIFFLFNFPYTLYKFILKDVIIAVIIFKHSQ